MVDTLRFSIGLLLSFTQIKYYFKRGKMDQITTSQDGEVCTTCSKVPPGFFERYQGFLLSTGTLIAMANSFLLLLGVIAEIFGEKTASDWLFLASALIGGAPIFKIAVKNIVESFDLTAGVMVSIALIAALLIGEYSAAAIVAFMMLIGEMLENFTLARADNAMKELQSLVPDMVTIIKEDDQESLVAIEYLRPGDIVLVRPGSRIPVDGTVKSGNAAVDQSAITGESIPLDKQIGDSVFAGTLCSNGMLQVSVRNVGAETTLGQMIRLVQEARSTQAPIQRIANKYAQYLTPATLTVAILVYLVTGDIMRSVTVLIVICPCSLVLATPTAVIAAIGNAAKYGTLVKNGTAMEQIGKVNVVAFDKTGTLTLGEPQVTQVVSLNGLSEHELLTLAASAERASEHPLARAVITAANEADLEIPFPESFETIPGHGISAMVNGQEVMIGERMLKQNGITFDQETASESRAGTLVPVAVGKQLAGLLVFSDAVRPESRNAVADLKALGIEEILLISGDNATVAEAIGKELGVDRIYSETLPEQKLELIRQVQSEGKKIVFVGDGVNDAPALAAADVGVAMGGIGTAAAMETADIILLTDEIERLPYLIDLSRSGLIVIRNNVIFSMTMNVISLFLGMFGVIGPVVGAIFHELSALPAIGNSVRLLGRKSRFIQTRPE